MTISPGSAWGEPGLLPAGAPIFSSDAELGDLVRAARRASTALPIVGLTGGTLWDAVGGPSAVGRLHTADAWHIPVDVVRATLDGTTTWFVSSLVARRGLWRDLVAAMNTPWFGAYRLGHRAHPGDALIDVIEGRSLTLADLATIAPRAKSGSYLPHPKLTERRVGEASWTFDRPRRVTVDGAAVGTVRSVILEVEPDALTVVV